MEGLALLLLVCMAVAMQYMITTPSILEEAYITKPLQRPSEVEISTLQYQIGYKFKSQALLMDALTHVSYSKHNNEAFNVLRVRVL
ncbi:unnamed protein product [Sphagnum compactum]